MPGFKTFTSATLTSSDVNSYLMQQANIQCTSATRPTPNEGMVIYETDTDRLYCYQGSAWVEFAEFGALRSWTPTITQTGSVTFTNTRSRYIRLGRQITCWFDLAVTGSGTGGVVIDVGGLPVTAASASSIAGAGRITDASVNSYAVSYEGTSTTAFRAITGTNSSYVGATPNFALASGDTIRGFVTYEV